MDNFRGHGTQLAATDDSFARFHVALDGFGRQRGGLPKRDGCVACRLAIPRVRSGKRVFTPLRISEQATRTVSTTDQHWAIKVTSQMIVFSHPVGTPLPVAHIRFWPSIVDQKDREKWLFHRR
jgi:hypothetical protein